jgi:hypothetical protein
VSFYFVLCYVIKFLRTGTYLVVFTDTMNHVACVWPMGAEAFLVGHSSLLGPLCMKALRILCISVLGGGQPQVQLRPEHGWWPFPYRHRGFHVTGYCLQRCLAITTTTKPVNWWKCSSLAGAWYLVWWAELERVPASKSGIGHGKGGETKARVLQWIRVPGVGSQPTGNLLDGTTSWQVARLLFLC